MAVNATATLEAPKPTAGVRTAKTAQPRATLALPSWSLEKTMVGVAHEGRRRALHAPFQVPTAQPPTPPGFYTTARQSALPWLPLGEHHVVLDTRRERALIAAPFTAGGLPTFPGTRTNFAQAPDMLRLDHHGYVSTGMSFAPSSADGDLAATVEMHDDGCHLVLLDLTTGARTHITALQGMYDPDTPMWSPDGQWILFSDHGGYRSEAQTVLVGLADKVVIPLNLDVPQAAATWWPQMGDSTLMVLAGMPGEQAVYTFDLSSAQLAHVTNVASEPLNPQEAMPSTVRGPMMSPDGDSVLVGDDRGTTLRYQRDHGAARRLAVLDPQTGTVVPLAPAFYEGTPVERVNSRWSWSEPQRAGAHVVVGAQVRAAATPLTEADPRKQAHVLTQSVWLWDPQR